MRRTVIIASAGVLVLGLLAVAWFSTALAQPALGPSAPAQQPDQQEQTSCHGDGGQDVVFSALAKALRMSEDQLNTELDAGKSVRDIARSRGLEEQKLAATLKGAMQDEMKSEVQNGDMPQAEADQMAKHIDQMSPGQLLDMIDSGTSDDMANGDATDEMMGGNATGSASPGGATTPNMTDDDSDGCHGGDTGQGQMF